DVGVGLDQAGQVLRVLPALVGRGDRLVQPGHLAGRVTRRTTDAARVPDPDHLIPGHDLVRVTGLGRLQPGGVLQLQYGDIVLLVVPDNTRRVRLPVADIGHRDRRR